MADFNTLVADVYTLTNRPDLVAETAIAVKSATLKLHSRDNFFKDLKEVAIFFNPSAYFQSIDYRSLVPTYRSIKYLRKYDFAGSTPGDFFEIIEPEQVLDSYNLQKQDICYVAGSSVQVKSSTKDSYMLLGCYVHPIVDTQSTFNSWIAIEFPFAIVFEAAAQVFSTLKDSEATSNYRAQANDMMAEIIIHNIAAKGY